MLSCNLAKQSYWHTVFPSIGAPSAYLFQSLKAPHCRAMLKNGRRLCQNRKIKLHHCLFLKKCKQLPLSDIALYIPKLQLIFISLFANFPHVTFILFTIRLWIDFISRRVFVKRRRLFEAWRLLVNQYLITEAFSFYM